MFKITKRLAYKMLDFQAEARFTFKLILKQFNDKTYGKLDRSKLSDADKQKVKRGMKELKNKDIMVSISKGYYLLNPILAKPEEKYIFLKSIWFYKKGNSVSYPPIKIEEPSDDILSDVNILVSNINGYKNHLMYFEFYDYLIDEDEEFTEEGLDPRHRYFYFGNSLKKEWAEISRLLDEFKKILSDLSDIDKSYDIYDNSDVNYYDLNELLHKYLICERIYDYTGCNKHALYTI